MRAALRAAVPKHRGMHLTTSTLPGFEELAIVSKLNGDEHLLRIISKLRNADGGSIIVVNEDKIESIQYVKPLNVNDVAIPDGFSTAVLRYTCGSAYIHQSDDHILCSDKNRILNRIRFGFSAPLLIEDSTDIGDLIRVFGEANNTLHVGTRKLILSYRHNFNPENGRTFLRNDPARCREILSCLKKHFKEETVQLWVDEILTRNSSSRFRSWVDVGLLPYCTAQVLILTDDFYSLDSMWLSLELNLALRCRGAVMTREERVHKLVSKLTAQAAWMRNGIHVQGCGQNPADALHSLLGRWISGCIPQNARDPEDVKMMDQLAFEMVNQLASDSSYSIDFYDPAIILSGRNFADFCVIRREVHNTYSCAEELTPKTIFDALFPRMPKCSERTIQNVAAARST